MKNSGSRTDEPGAESAPAPNRAHSQPSRNDQVWAQPFSHVDTWVFDLDNTLYPTGSDLWRKIDERITLFLAHLFGLDGMSSRALQKYYYQRYGTTLRGLMHEHAISADEFLTFVHDIDRSSLTPNHSLASAITALPGRKLILTNGSKEHALSTARQLGIDQMFEDIFDIVAADLVPKPAPETYDRFFARHAVEPRRSAMFEDLGRNLIVPHERGMVTTLVIPKNGEPDRRESWEREDKDSPHIDFVTDDIESFLQSIIQTSDAAPDSIIE